jgi:hypothetical protein
MKQILVIFLFILIHQNNDQDLLMTKREINLWKNDSLSCLGKRRSIYFKILKEKNRFVGMSESKIKFYFGKPNIIQKSVDYKRFYYFVENGPQCTFVKKMDMIR